MKALFLRARVAFSAWKKRRLVPQIQTNQDDRMDGIVECYTENEPERQVGKEYLYCCTPGKDYQPGEHEALVTFVDRSGKRSLALRIEMDRFPQEEIA